MKKTHKIALMPTHGQATAFAQHCGYARVAYNHALNDFKAQLAAGKFEPFSLRTQFNAVKYEDYEWCAQLCQVAGRQAIQDLVVAIRKWANKKLPNRFPKYRSRRKGMSFVANETGVPIPTDGRRIHLPKIGWIRMREALRYVGAIYRVTIAKQHGRWFACIIVDTDEAEPPKREGETIHIDARQPANIAGPNAKTIGRLYRKLAREWKGIRRSRKQIGNNKSSRRRSDRYVRMTKLNNRIAQLRGDDHHKATSAICKAKTAGRVVIDIWASEAMRGDKRLAHACERYGIYDFAAMLAYKSGWYGIEYERRDHNPIDAAGLAESINGREGAVRPAMRQARPTKRLSAAA